MLASAITYIRVQSFLFIIKRDDPDSELKYACKENDHTANLNGFQFVARVFWEFMC